MTEGQIKNKSNVRSYALPLLADRRWRGAFVGLGFVERAAGISVNGKRVTAAGRSKVRRYAVSQLSSNLPV